MPEYKIKNNIILLTSGPLAPDFIAPFWIGDVRYSSLDQWVASEKASMAGDFDKMESILLEKSPIVNRRQAAEIEDTQIWMDELPNLIKYGMLNKFNQNTELLEELKSTGEYAFAYAGDEVYGTGLLAEDENNFDFSKWGQNLIGKALVEVRRFLPDSHSN